MLIEFSVGNFRSFKEVATFSMVAANLQSQDKAVDASNTFSVSDKLRLLKSAAIYGANASGKSNLAKAMQFMRQFALSSSKDTQADEPIAVDMFRLSETTLHEPSFFQIVFLQDGIQYRYGFEVTAERVISEWLFSSATTREANLFQRDTNGIRSNPKFFKEGKGLEDRTRDNALFLSVVAQFNGKTAKGILEWFRYFNIISGSDYDSYMGYSLDVLSGKEHRTEAQELIVQLDLDIQSIKVKKDELEAGELPAEVVSHLRRRLRGMSEGDAMKFERVAVQSIHPFFDGEGNPSSTVTVEVDTFESEGTQKLIALSGPLVDTLKRGGILFVDELDARLHPLMTCAIIRLFNSQDENPHNAQLIFATHDTNLLSNALFRRDQIWFAEKDRQRSTHLYSLAEFRVRNDDRSLASDYIHGKFGAIPFLGNLNGVFGAAEARNGAEK